MDLRKPLFFEHLLSSKRRVVSGFGVGAAASLLVIFLLLFLGAPPAASSSSSSILSWFFSVPEQQKAVGPPSPEEGLETASVDGNSSRTTVGEDAGGPSNHSVNAQDLSGKIQFQEDKPKPSAAIKDGDGGTAPPEENIIKGARSSIPRPSNGTRPSGGDGIPEKTQYATRKNASRDGDDGKILEFRDGVGGQDQERNRLDPGGAGKNHNTSCSSGEGRASERVEEEEAAAASSSSAGKNNSTSNNNRNNNNNGSGPSKAPGPGGLSGKCDIFDGRWVRDEQEPYYPAGSCPFIDRDFDCHTNGRPDDGFLKWRWQPYHCDIPRLNATDFLERLRGKRILFVGDSLNRNMWESLVCILRHSVKYKKRVYEASGRSQFKTRGYYSFKFKDYKCSVDFVRSPFLVRELYYKNANGSEDEKLRLDVLDETTSSYREADIVVFNTGHWWTHEKTSKGIDYYQEGDHVYPVLKVMEAYKKALTTWARWVDKNINSKKTQVVFRGYSLTHFRGGQWNSGGQCHKEIEPIFNQSYLAHYPSKMRALEQILKQMKTTVVYLNISRLTDYRKDGHPSIYRKKYQSVEEQIAAEKTQDCSHWCLPGIPDSWNELLYASLLMVGKGSWRR
ncbi:protein trichome birefringence-like 2 [Elaeis guineensis]|uniref:protein trichome birefringence-like 2 n=1 Tax=Elaeis guineensis var. tenera TaxID=51953 RepID=UPI003C6D876A